MGINLLKQSNTSMKKLLKWLNGDLKKMSNVTRILKDVDDEYIKNEILNLKNNIDDIYVEEVETEDECWEFVNKKMLVLLKTSLFLFLSSKNKEIGLELLELMVEKLNSPDAVLTEFLKIVIHELGSPLNNLNNNIGSLEHYIKTGDKEKALKILDSLRIAQEDFLILRDKMEEMIKLKDLALELFDEGGFC